MICKYYEKDSKIWLCPYNIVDFQTKHSNKKEWKVMKVVKMSGRERNMRNHSPVNKIDSRRAME